MKAIAYIRCATPNTEYSQAQDLRCREYAQQHGLDIVQTYSETGHARSSSERMLAAITKHGAEAVIVKDAAHLSRNPVEYAYLTAAFREADVKLCIADLNHEPGVGSFAAGLLAVIAAAEPELPEDDMQTMDEHNE